LQFCDSLCMPKPSLKLSQNFKPIAAGRGAIAAMKKPIRLALRGLLAVFTLLLVAALALLLNSERKLHRVLDVNAAPVAYSADPAAPQRGKYLFDSRGCADCHGAGGGGKVFIDDPKGLYSRSANLTRGKGSAVLGYTELDWVRTIRHGVNPQGRALFPMPSEDYNRLSNADLADLVAYVRALPPQDGLVAETRLPLIVRLAHGAGVVKDAAEKIDHTLPPSTPVPVAVTPEHGLYVAQTCKGCHGPQLLGGPVPGGPPDWPPAARLTTDATGVMGRYTDAAAFKAMMRSGLRPDGSAVSSVMPFSSLKQMNDTDLDALFVYLQSRGAPSEGNAAGE
jgi:mono/diheme cytochrome c family protein